MSDDFSRRAFLAVAGVGAAGAVGGALAADEPAGGVAPGKLKIVGVATSLRAGQSTAAALARCLEAARQVAPDHIETELIDLGGKHIPAGPAAGLELSPGEADDFPAIAPQLSAHDVAAIVVGSPVYFGNMSSHCKAFLERCMAFRKEGFSLSNKVAAVIAVGGNRNGGQELTIRAVQAALMAQNMLIVGEAKPASHPGAAVWNNSERFLDDEGNAATIASVGRRVAEVVLMLAGRPTPT